jgi:hypothetical protein
MYFTYHSLISFHSKYYSICCNTCCLKLKNVAKPVLSKFSSDGREVAHYIWLSVCDEHLFICVDVRVVMSSKMNRHYRVFYCNKHVSINFDLSSCIHRFNWISSMSWSAMIKSKRGDISTWNDHNMELFIVVEMLSLTFYHYLQFNCSAFFD